MCLDSCLGQNVKTATHAEKKSLVEAMKTILFDLQDHSKYCIFSNYNLNLYIKKNHQRREAILVYEKVTNLLGAPDG